MSLVNIKSVTITDKGQISISKEMRTKKGFKKGQRIALLEFDNHIELRAMDEVEKKFGTAIASEKSLGKLWNLKEEDIRWKHLK